MMQRIGKRNPTAPESGKVGVSGEDRREPRHNEGMEGGRTTKLWSSARDQAAVAFVHARLQTVKACEEMNFQRLAVMERILRGESPTEEGQVGEVPP